MARAKKPGSPVGRPEVLNRTGMAEKWLEIRPFVQSGQMSQREAAKTLGVGRATIARMLARKKPDTEAAGGYENPVVPLAATSAS